MGVDLARIMASIMHAVPVCVCVRNFVNVCRSFLVNFFNRQCTERREGTEGAWHGACEPKAISLWLATPLPAPLGSPWYVCSCV